MRGLKLSSVQLSRRFHNRRDAARSAWFLLVNGMMCDLLGRLGDFGRRVRPAGQTITGETGEQFLHFYYRQSAAFRNAVAL